MPPKIPSSATPVIVFDIDGTLTASTGVDDECLIGAWREVWPTLGAVSTDWSTYEHSTDEGLTHEIGRGVTGRAPSSQEVARVKGRFLEMLARRIEGNPQRCAAIAGAGELLREIRRRGWALGIASGAWEESGRLKLRVAGLDVEGIPATFSHADGAGRPVKRPELIAGTFKKLGIGRDEFAARGVYIGDGLWDARAARELGMRFVAMRHDRVHDHMLAEGVRTILNDYGSASEVLEMIERLPRAGATTGT